MASPLDAAAWRQEAEAVVADIAPHVSQAALSSLPAGAGAAYLNVTTLEGRRVTVRLSAAGFALCGDGPDSDVTADGDGRVFETPYALLHAISPRYTGAFGRELAEKLGRLGGAEEGDCGSTVDGGGVENERTVDRGGAENERIVDRGGAKNERSVDRGGAENERTVDGGGAENERTVDRGGVENERTVDRGGAKNERSVDGAGTENERILSEQDGVANSDGV